MTNHVVVELEHKAVERGVHHRVRSTTRRHPFVQ